MTDAAKIFAAKYNSASTIELEFNPNWQNGTGYFDPLANNFDFAHLVDDGCIARSKTSFGRRILIVGTALGNIVVFDRYDDVDDAVKTVFVGNIRKGLRDYIYFCGRITDDQMLEILGDEDDCWRPNAGVRLNRIIETLVERNKVRHA